MLLLVLTPSQDEIISCPITQLEQKWSSKHRVKPGFIDQIIGLDVSSDTSPFDTKRVENPPIFNLYLQEQAGLNYNQESKMKLQKLN